jgi:hypothetical protein
MTNKGINNVKARASATAGPYGMTNRRTGNDKNNDKNESKDNSKDNSRSLRDDKQKGQDKRWTTATGRTRARAAVDLLWEEKKDGLP